MTNYVKALEIPRATKHPVVINGIAG